ncbi:hypothetical protein BSM4216_0801 [Bacillus smithii]|jgi:hypothetical protein|nr:hypothetical protein BSM4216_0801 [Bacillus smithii]
MHSYEKIIYSKREFLTYKEHVVKHLIHTFIHKKSITSEIPKIDLQGMETISGTADILVL